MVIDIQRERQETPGCHEVLHFNNAGAALMPKPVNDVILQHLEREMMIGAYEAAEKAQEAVAHFYRVAAQLIHCAPEEIAFAENATRAWEMVFYALPFQRGDRILTTVAEYASNYIAFLQVAKKTGVQIEIIPDDEFGQTSVKSLEKMIDKRVKLISLAHIPTQGGLVNPADAIGKIANEAGIFYLLDSTQSVGQLPIDVNKTLTFLSLYKNMRGLICKLAVCPVSCEPQYITTTPKTKSINSAQLSQLQRKGTDL
jgi:selenocysteine lyase/cysteine desulfurase